MTDFGVDIKIDSTSGEAALRRVTSELERVERAAKQAEATVKRGVAEGNIKWSEAAEIQKRLQHELIASEKAAEAAERASSGFAAALSRGFGGLTQQLSGIGGTIGGIGSALGGLGLAAGGIGALTSSITGVVDGLMSWYDAQLRLNDNLIMMRNQLRGVTDDVGGLMEKTRDLANRTMTDWNTTVDVYGRVARSLNGLGKSETETLRITETLQKSFATSGRSAQETSAAMLQLSQALGSGVLQGDEFRSISENAPQLLKVFADQLGVTRAELKKMGSEGKITTDIMIRGLEGMADSADRAFAQMEKTQAMKDAGLRNLLASDPTLINKSIQPGSLSDLEGAKNLLDTLNQSGRVTPIYEALGLDVGTADKVSETNAQIGKLTDSIKAYKQVLDSLSGSQSGGGIANDISLWSIVFQGPESTKFGGGMLSDLEQFGIKAPDAMKDFQDSLKFMPAAMADVKAIAGTFLGLSDNIQMAGSSLADLTKANDWTDLVHRVEAVAKAMDPWANTLPSLDANTKKVHHGMSDLEKLFHSIVDPERHFARDMTNLDLLLQRGRITVEQYDAAMRKLITTFKGANSSDWRLMQIDGWSQFQQQLKDVVEEFDAIIARQQTLTDLSGAWSRFSADAARSRDQREMVGAQGRAFTFDLNEVLYAGGKRTGSSFSAERDFTSWGGGDLTERGQQQAIGYTKRWTEELEKNRKKWEDVDKFGQQAMGHIEDAMVRLVETGKFSFKSLVESILADLTRLATHRLLMSIIGGIGGGGTASVFGTGATQGFSGLYGGPHATGGTYTAPRTGGMPDSIPVLFHMSPGETANFTPQGQAGNGNVSVRNETYFDPRQLRDFFAGPDGREIVHQHVMKLPKSAFR